MLLRSLLAVGTLVSSAFAVAYNESGWSFEGVVDASNGLTIGFTFPPDAEQPASGAEFIGHVAATASTSRWLGIALGGKMVNNTLLIAWPNGQNITSSVRRASQYGVPPVYTGPVVTTIRASVTASGWSWVYRCQNCTTWTGGNLAYQGNASPQISWAKGTAAPQTPASASSSFSKHAVTGKWNQNMSASKNANYKSYITPSTGTSSSAVATRTA